MLIHKTTPFFSGFFGILLGLGWAAPGRAADFPGGPDPYTWLENASSPRAMDWVNAQNETTTRALGADARFKGFVDVFRASASVGHQLAHPTQKGAWIFNFWTDAKNPHGILRRVRSNLYDEATIPWETVIDFDQLDRSEGKSWVYEGASCLPPYFDRCLLRLSNGGGDAIVVREFDVDHRVFVAAAQKGFVLPEAKTEISWADQDRVFVATDFGEGSMTKSGYPRIVKLWKRGEALSAASTVFEVPVDSVGASGMTEFRPEGDRMILTQHPSFFQTETFWLKTDGTKVRLPFPLDSEYEGSFKGHFLARLLKDWQVGDRVFNQGSLVALSEKALDDKTGKPEQATELVYAPGAGVTIDEISLSRDHVYLNVLANVQSQLLRIDPIAKEWPSHPVALPGQGTLAVESTSPVSNRIYVSFKNYLTPATLYRINEGTEARAVQSLTPEFDAKELVSEQNFATSADGTRVPYFIVHPKGMKLDGTHPTILYGYGGFDISLTPSYLGATGNVWLSKGGVYVVANIRGGGEFGPAWHDAALQTHRQKAYDDFIAVAEDLIARQITTPRRLGIMGGSNGGLLVGTVFVERPDLFNAMVCQVPLLDMARYPAIAAGSSWIPEYGDPRDPAMWAAISKYSPYQNVAPLVAYPKPFIWTSTADDRVGPGHARKMAAKMEAQGHPVFYYENPEGGHGSGADLEQKSRLSAMEFSYLFEQLFD